MTILDANKLDHGSRITADICIVGAGAAGISLALELKNTGAKICLVESGGFKLEEQVQALYDVNNLGYPIRENFMSRVRQYGGSCNIWAGRSMRLHPIDFKERDWIPNSGWPFDYAHIESWYERAEALLRLPIYREFTATERLRGAGDHEMAVLEDDATEPAIATWATKPMRFGKVYKRELSRSKNIDVYLNLNVTSLRSSESGNAITEVVANTLDLREVEITARHFVLAAGGLESARLLLASQERHEKGVGNDFDQVGRYFLDHPRAIFGTIHLHDDVRLPYLVGLPLATGKVQFGIAASENYQRQHQMLNCYASLEPQLSEFAQTQYGRSVNIAKAVTRKGHAGSRFKLDSIEANDMRDLIYYLTPKELMPHFMYRPYAFAKRLVRRFRPVKTLTVINFCEQVPDRESRVCLSRETDALGMPKLELHWRVSDEMRHSVAQLHRMIGGLFRANGIGKLESDLEALKYVRFSDASHHIGTTRMSDSRQHGVVDSDCKVHGVDNLYVSSSSVFPTGGYANPTLTIIALALRLAEHLRARIAV